MAYTLPVFNLDSRITTDVTSPNEGPTWGANILCQKYTSTKWPGRGEAQALYSGGYFVQLRFEPVAFYAQFPLSSIWQWALTFVELGTAGSQQWYRIYSWEVAHQGFANEYPFCIACLCDHTDWALFIPPGSANTNGIPITFGYYMGPITP